MKLTKAQSRILDKIYLNTEVCGYRSSGYLSICQNGYMPRRKPEMKTVKELQALGLLEPDRAWPVLSEAGWAAVGRTPMKEYLHNLRREIDFRIADARKNRYEDRASWSECNVAFYRQLYQNPEMATEQVKTLELERVRDNRVHYEADVQEAEQVLAYWELKSRS